MLEAPIQLIHAPGYVSTTSAAIPGDHVFRASVQIVSTGSSAAGSVVFQASNDVVVPPFQPSHWSNLASAVVISAANTYLIAKTNITYQWLRAVFTSTAPGEQTIATVADVGSLDFEIEEFLPVGGPPDGGSLIMDFGGTPVTMLFSDNAATFQTQIQAIPAYSAATVSGDFTVGFTINMGVYPDPALGTVTTNTLVKGIVPVGINVMSAPGDFTSTLNNSYFLCSDSNDTHKYAVWFNVSGQGVAPVVAGYTSEEVDIVSQDTADNVATALSAVLAGLTGFASSVIATNNVALNNLTAGPFTPALDSVPAPTGFTFAISATNGTVSVNLKTLGD